MRECIYCGRQIEKGEKCSCAMSVAKRMEREQQAKEQPQKTKKQEKEQARAEKAQAKEQAKRDRERRRQQASQFKQNNRGFKTFHGGGNVFANVWRLFISFLKSPIDTMLNPGKMDMIDAVLMTAFEGAIGGLCVFALTTGASRGVFSFIGNMVGFHGVEGYRTILSWIMAAVSGMFSGILIFFLYSGIFYLVNRWIFRMFSTYKDFVKRFAFIAIPMTLIGIVGAILGLFSIITFAAFMISGVAVSVILTYELLSSMWSSKSQTKTLYTIMICLVIFMLIAVRLAVLF